MFVILIPNLFPLNLILMDWNALVSQGMEDKSYHPILGVDYKLGLKHLRKVSLNIIFSILLMENISFK